MRVGILICMSRHIASSSRFLLQMLVLVCVTAACLVSAEGASEPPGGESSAAGVDGSNAADEPSDASAGSVVTPFIGPAPPADEPVQWDRVARSSTLFLGIMHSFRLATEKGTREGMRGPFFAGYADSLGAMHGWRDGDPPLVNWVGHPMQGAASGFLFSANDVKYRSYPFGRDRRYWKGRLRSTAFAWLFSTQFEIGPFSEASIGNVQAKYPAHGFEDHVLTPVIGLGWMVAEDALDRYVVRWIERRSEATWVRIVARLGLNPARGFANVMAFRNPWRRDDRPTIYWDYEDEELIRSLIGPPARAEAPSRRTPVLELTAQPQAYWFGVGSARKTPCVGGGALAHYPLSESWGLVADVGGCRLQGLGRYRSGDSLTYLFGPRWTPRRQGRWAPHVRMLLGGQKVTEAQLKPDEIRRMEADGLNWKKNEYRSQVADHFDKNALAFLVGGGLDVVIHPALSLQVASFDYLHTRLGELRGRDYGHNVRFAAGLTLRVGTW